jgi:hypothetical protein
VLGFLHVPQLAVVLADRVGQVDAAVGVPEEDAVHQ